MRTVLAEDGTEEAFALDAMGEEMTAVEVVTYKIADDIPLRLCTAGKDVGPQLVTNPADVLFVFVGVVGAGAVDHQSAWSEAVPDVGYDVALTFGTHLDILQRPVTDGSFILAKHPFA